MTSKPNMPPAVTATPAATRSPWQGVVAWVLLDWAGSAFSTLSITLLVAYFERVVFATNPLGLPGGVIWAWTLAFAMLVIDAAPGAPAAASVRVRVELP